VIELITGLPGGGKTLLLVADLKKNAESSTPRPTFVNGVPGLSQALLWTPLTDPTNWQNDMPEGAIVVIDECQHYFPPRPSGSRVPDFISSFETHRHRGLDLVLITQHPKLLDQNLRRLIERHRHVTRVFGSSFQNVYEWNTCNESPEPPQSLKNANCKKQRFDKSLFSLYKSATQHTHRARLPWRRIAVGTAAIFACFGLVGKFLLDKTAQASALGQPEKNVQDAQQQGPQKRSMPSENNTADPDEVHYQLTGIVRFSDGYPRYLVESSDGRILSNESFAQYHVEPGQFCFKLKTEDNRQCVPITING
jgi:hypothetical protein